MATIKSLGFKYHTCETNRIESLLTGNTFGQLGLKAADFAVDPCQNGMFLVYDTLNGHVRKPASADEVVYLQYSSPLLYDVRVQGTADFAVGIENEINPVLVPLTVDDVIHTDAVNLGAGVVLDQTIVGKLGVVGTDGYIVVNNAAPAATNKIVVRVEKLTTMPHGGVGLKLKVVRANNNIA